MKNSNSCRKTVTWSLALKKLNLSFQSLFSVDSETFLSASSEFSFHGLGLLEEGVALKTYHKIFLYVIRMILVWQLSSSFTSNIHLCQLINICSPWNHQKTIDFLMISRRIEVHWFAWIRLILEDKFGDNPLFLIIL